VNIKVLGELPQRDLQAAYEVALPVNMRVLGELPQRDLQAAYEVALPRFQDKAMEAAPAVLAAATAQASRRHSMVVAAAIAQAASMVELAVSGSEGTIGSSCLKLPCSAMGCAEIPSGCRWSPRKAWEVPLDLLRKQGHWASTQHTMPCCGHGGRGWEQAT